MAVASAREKQQQHRTDDVMRQALNQLVATNPDLDGVDLRVYLYMSASLNFDTPVHVPQVQLATILGRQKTHISRSLRKLVKAGVLMAGESGTRGSEWMLNPDCGA